MSEPCEAYNHGYLLSLKDHVRRVATLVGIPVTIGYVSMSAMFCTL